MTPFSLILLVVIGTTIWVGIDAGNLGMHQGRQGGGFLDMGPAGWVFACLLLWIISFPCYLAARTRYKNTQMPATAYGVPLASAPSWGPHSPPPPPPVTSPDGRWWWDGQQWVAMPVAAPR
jgi:hypothetical protein